MNNVQQDINEMFENVSNNVITGDLSVITMQRNDTGDEPMFYSELGRGIYSDEMLLQDAWKDLGRNIEGKDESSVEYKKSASRQAFEDAMYDYLRYQVLPKAKNEKLAVTQKKEEELRNVVIYYLNRLNYGREMNNMSKMSTKEVEIIRDTILEQIIKEEEEVSCPSYVSNDLSLGHVSEWDDDAGDFICAQDISDEDDYLSSIAQDEHVQNDDDGVDYDLSHKTCMAIFKQMDPNATGYAFKPLKFNGKYISKNGAEYSLKNKSVKQSLVYLAKFARDARFDWNTRNSLFQFVKSSWELVRVQEEVVY